MKRVYPMVKITCLGCGKDTQYCVCDDSAFCGGCGKSFKDCVCSNLNHTDWQDVSPWRIWRTRTDSSTSTSYPEAICGDMGIEDELIEQLKAIRNRCDAVMWLLENPNAFYVIHTLLKDIYESAEIIVEDFCVEDDD